MTITANNVGAILAKCGGYRPDKTPQPSEIVAMAWVEHFSDFPAVTLEDALEAVKVYHREPQDRMIQPADIGKVARAIRRDKSDRETDEIRRLREELCDAKATGRRESIAAISAKLYGA